jgi:hypothetical protein
MPSRLTNSVSVCSEPVKSSAHTYRSGFAARAASSIATPTCSGVEWQLSIRKPSNVRASSVTYSVIYFHSHGFAAGPSP